MKKIALFAALAFSFGLSALESPKSNLDVLISLGINNREDLAKASDAEIVQIMRDILQNEFAQEEYYSWVREVMKQPAKE